MRDLFLLERRHVQLNNPIALNILLIGTERLMQRLQLSVSSAESKSRHDICFFYVHLSAFTLYLIGPDLRRHSFSLYHLPSNIYVLY